MTGTAVAVLVSAQSVSLLSFLSMSSTSVSSSSSSEWICTLLALRSPFCSSCCVKDVFLVVGAIISGCFIFCVEASDPTFTPEPVSSLSTPCDSGGDVGVTVTVSVAEVDVDVEPDPDPVPEAFPSAVLPCVGDCGAMWL